MDQQIRIISLFSGSKGNCTYCSVYGYEFLIDAGGSCKRICCALKNHGTDLSAIQDIFITHEHKDHIAALPVLSKKTNARIHMNALSAQYAQRQSPALCGRIQTHPLSYEVSDGHISISSFPLSHDSVSCVGFLVRIDGEKLLCVATDTGVLTSEAEAAISGCRYAICEANHDSDMLIFGSYPPFLKERILSSVGHLSNKDCASLVKRILSNGCERVMLAHLSEENNTPDLAYATIIRECGDEYEKRVCVASQSRATVLV